MIDMTGKEFGELKVIGLSDKKHKNGSRLWECLCSCGETTYVLGVGLRQNNYKSCGCKRIEKRNRGVKNHIKKDRIDGTRKTALKAKLHKENKSGHKGVIWMKSRNKWKAYIGIKGKQITLGYYTIKEDAIAARLEAEKKYHQPYIESDKEGDK